MSKRGRTEHEIINSKKIKNIDSPTSINVIETAKLSDAKYRLLGYSNETEGKYIAEYIFELHDNVCPEYVRVFYDEIKTDLKFSHYNVTKSKTVKNIDTLLDFVENKCMNYRFVASILTITFYLMDDLTYSEKNELIFWDKDKLSDFFFTKRPNKATFTSTNFRGNNNIFPHANSILIDRELRQVERFEPHGSETIMASEELDNLLERSFNKIGYKYFSPKSFCPVQSVQSIHGLAKNPLYKDIGYCTIWSMWYMDNRLLNPLKTRDQTINMIIDMFKSKDEKFIHETIHFYWTNLLRYIELRSDNVTSKRAMEIMYHETIPKLGEEKMLNTPRAVTKYIKPKSMLSKIFGY